MLDGSEQLMLDGLELLMLDGSELLMLDGLELLMLDGSELLMMMKWTNKELMRELKLKSGVQRTNNEVMLEKFQ